MHTQTRENPTSEITRKWCPGICLVSWSRFKEVTVSRTCSCELLRTILLKNPFVRMTQGQARGLNAPGQQVGSSWPEGTRCKHDVAGKRGPDAVGEGSSRKEAGNRSIALSSQPKRAGLCTTPKRTRGDEAHLLSPCRLSLTCRIYTDNCEWRSPSLSSGGKGDFWPSFSRGKAWKDTPPVPSPKGRDEEISECAGGWLQPQQGQSAASLTQCSGWRTKTRFWKRTL